MSETELSPEQLEGYIMIPSDIRTTASEIISMMDIMLQDPGVAMCFDLIADALMQERARCAKIAEDLVLISPQFGRDTADAIAAAIRSPTEDTTQERT